jgi:hypothetical protein
MPFPVASTVPSSNRGGRPVDGPSATMQIDPSLLAGLVAGGGETATPVVDGVAATAVTTEASPESLAGELAEGMPDEAEAFPVHDGTEPCSCCSGAWTLLGGVMGLANGSETVPSAAPPASPGAVAATDASAAAAVTGPAALPAASAPSAAGDAAATTPAGAAAVPAAYGTGDTTDAADATAASTGEATVTAPDEGGHAPSLPPLPMVAHRNARARGEHGSPTDRNVPPGPSPMAADSVPGLGPRSRTAPGLDEEARTAPVDTTGAREPSPRADAVADPGMVHVRTTAPEVPSTVQAPARAESLLRAEHVRYARELAPSREIQRLAVELDDARVAVRLDQGTPRVDVIADPSNRLGTSWLADVRQAFSSGAFSGRDGLDRDTARNGQGQDRRRDDDGRRFGQRIGDLAAAGLQTETEGAQP